MFLLLRYGIEGEVPSRSSLAYGCSQTHILGADGRSCAPLVTVEGETKGIQDAQWRCVLIAGDKNDDRRKELLLLNHYSSPPFDSVPCLPSNKWHVDELAMDYWDQD